MVPDPAETTRQRSLWRRRPWGAGTRTAAGGAQEIPPGTVLLPASGCKNGWDLRRARGRWASVCSRRPCVRASVRPPQPLSCGQADQPLAACSSLGRLSAPRARPGIRLREAPTLRPAPRRPLPLPRWDARPAPGACSVAHDPAGAAGKGAGVGAVLTFFGTRPGQPRPNCG